jgi:Tfp pilus assembly protein PilN
MRALDLDLVRRRPSWPAWLMLLIGLALAADALASYLNLREELDQVARNRAGPQIVAARPQEVLSEQTQREVVAARRTLEELTLPWDTLFATIEDAIGGDTALLAIEPDAGKRVVRISGEARSYPAVLGLVARLEASAVLSGVHLSNHQIREDVPERPYQFTLLATWKASP